MGASVALALDFPPRTGTRGPLPGGCAQIPSGRDETVARPERHPPPHEPLHADPHLSLRSALCWRAAGTWPRAPRARRLGLAAGRARRPSAPRVRRPPRHRPLSRRGHPCGSRTCSAAMVASRCCSWAATSATGSSANGPTRSSWPPSTLAAARWPWSACRATRSTCPSLPGEAYAERINTLYFDLQQSTGKRKAALEEVRAALAYSLRDGDRPRRPRGLRRPRQAHRQHRRHRRHARRADVGPDHAPRREGPQAEGRPPAPRAARRRWPSRAHGTPAATTTAPGASSRSSPPPRRRCARRDWLRCRPSSSWCARRRSRTSRMLAAPAVLELAAKADLCERPLGGARAGPLGAPRARDLRHQPQGPRDPEALRPHLRRV